MALRVIVFVDFWNLQLGWNREADGLRLDWASLRQTLAEAAVVETRGSAENRPFVSEMIVYASFNPETEAKLEHWLHAFLGSRISTSVKLHQRKTVERRIRCQSCGANFRRCPVCQRPLLTSPEKGVDAALTTDLVALAADSMFDLAVLVSNDADFIPAVQWTRARGPAVVNASWRHQGTELRGASTAVIDLNRLIPRLAR